MVELTEKDLQDVPLEDEYTAMLESQGEEATKAFYICNAFKYLHRQKRNGGVKDIKKAKWCLEKYLDLEGKKEGESKGRAGQFVESICRDWTGDYILRTEEGSVRLTPKEAGEWMKKRLKETEDKLIQ